MTANSLHLTTTLGLTLSAGLVMVLAGTRKKLLEWKTTQRCQACGSRDRQHCPCRR
jgi:hypothetical protein